MESDTDGPGPHAADAPHPTTRGLGSAWRRPSGSEKRWTPRREIEIERRACRGYLVVGKADPGRPARCKHEQPGKGRDKDRTADRTGDSTAEVVPNVVLRTAIIGPGCARGAYDIARMRETVPHDRREKALQDEPAKQDEPNGTSRHR